MTSNLNVVLINCKNFIYIKFISLYFYTNKPAVKASKQCISFCMLLSIFFHIDSVKHFNSPSKAGLFILCDPAAETTLPPLLCTLLLFLCTPHFYPWLNRNMFTWVQDPTCSSGPRKRLRKMITNDCLKKIWQRREMVVDIFSNQVAYAA